MAKHHLVNLRIEDALFDKLVQRAASISEGNISQAIRLILAKDLRHMRRPAAKKPTTRKAKA